MSDFLDEVRDDCTEAETDLGLKKMTWAQLDYPVAPTLIRRGAVLVIGGKEVEIKLTLRVRYSGITSSGREWDFSELDSIPKQGERVTYDGKAYRIAQVNNAQAFLEIDLMDVNR